MNKGNALPPSPKTQPPLMFGPKFREGRSLDHLNLPVMLFARTPFDAFAPVAELPPSLLAASVRLLLVAALLVSASLLVPALLVTHAATAAALTPVSSSSGKASTSSISTAAVRTAAAAIPPATAAIAATTTAAAIAATTAAGAARGTLRGFIHANLPSVKFDVIHLSYGLLSCRLFRETHEAKAAAATGVAVLDNDRFINLTEFLELCAQRVVIGVPGEAANE